MVTMMKYSHESEDFSNGFSWRNRNIQARQQDHVLLAQFVTSGQSQYCPVTPVLSSDASTLLSSDTSTVLSSDTSTFKKSELVVAGLLVYF